MDGGVLVQLGHGLLPDEGVGLQLGGEHVVEDLEEQEDVLGGDVLEDVVGLLLGPALLDLQRLKAEAELDDFVVVDLVDEDDVDVDDAQDELLDDAGDELEEKVAVLGAGVKTVFLLDALVEFAKDFLLDLLHLLLVLFAVDVEHVYLVG